MMVSREQGARLLLTKTELEQTKTRFLQLLADIPDEDWNRPIPGEHWCARQEMAHVAQVVRTLPVGIKRATSGRGGRLLALAPISLRRWVNGYIIVPVITRGETRSSVMAAYEKAHVALLQILEGLAEDAWNKGTAFGGEYLTVQDMAHRPVEHFDEHSAHLRRALGLR